MPGMVPAIPSGSLVGMVLAGTTTAVAGAGGWDCAEERAAEAADAEASCRDAAACADMSWSMRLLPDC